MTRFVRIILFALLTVALHGMAGNVSIGKAVGQVESTVTCPVACSGDTTAPEQPDTPVAELTNLQGRPISVTRVQRVQFAGYFIGLRNLLQCCAERDNALSQHWGRTCNLHFSYGGRCPNKYYVFALRRIIV